MLIDGRRFLIVGHRGAAARAPENTAASLRAGLDAGADAVELDVGLSADGRAVVLHDADLDRTTDGRGRVDDWDWRRLSTLDAGSWFSPRFRGEPLLDLDGALALIRPRAPALVEIKGKEREGERVTARDLRLADEVLAALDRTGGLAGAGISSSHWPLLQEIARRNPAADLALTVRWRERRDPLEWARRVGASALHPNRRLCSRGWVARAREAGLVVIAYTVNRAAEARAALEAGVDGIFTDDPGALVRWARRLAPEPGRSGGDDVLLGIDQGSGGTRAALIRADGGLVAVRESPIASRRLPDGSVVQDGEAVAASIARASATVLKDASRPPRAVGLATQRGSLLVWTRRDARPVTPVLSWRAGPGQAPSAAPDLDEERVASRTGLTTRYPYGAYRLARKLIEDPGLAEGLRRGRLVAGPLGSFLAARFGLRSRAPADPSLAQRTLLWDLGGRDWNRKRAERFGIPVEGLPPVRPSVAGHGSLRLGSCVVPLRALVGDVGAAVRGIAGAGPAPFGALILGTGGFVVAPTGSRRRRVPGLLTSILWSDPKATRYAVEGTVHGLAASLVQGADRAGVTPRDLSWFASRSGPARRSPRVVAAPEGLGTPWWDLTPRFEVQDGNWTDEEIARGTLAALAEPFAAIASLLRDASILPERFVAAGGLAASPHLVTALGRAMGVDTVIDTRPHRTAVGAALLAGECPDG